MDQNPRSLPIRPVSAFADVRRRARLALAADCMDLLTSRLRQRGLRPRAMSAAS